MPKRNAKEDQGAPDPKGESGSSGTLPNRNWRECAWKNLDDNRDHGLIKVRLNCICIKIPLRFITWISHGTLDHKKRNWPQMLLFYTLTNRSIRCTIYWTLTLRLVANKTQGVVKVKIIPPASFTSFRAVRICFLLCLSAFAVYSESFSPSFFAAIATTSTFLQFKTIHSDPIQSIPVHNDRLSLFWNDELVSFLASRISCRCENQNSAELRRFKSE